MWCKKCNLETNEKMCPICSSETLEDKPVEIYWCSCCSVPIVHYTTDADKGICPICGHITQFLTSDIRPVFPEERLLLAFLLNKKPDTLMNQSVWAMYSRYYINGKSVSISSKTFAESDTETISKKISANTKLIDYSYFDNDMEKFILANQHRLAFLKDEAFSFIKQTTREFKEENIVISFSGGKDSTVTADLVKKALSNPSLVHIFGNTTLEFPTTIEYASRFRENNPLAIFQIAKNDEQIFLMFVMTLDLQHE